MTQYYDLLQRVLDATNRGLDIIRDLLPVGPWLWSGQVPHGFGGAGRTLRGTGAAYQTRELNIVMNETSRYKLHPERCARLADGLPLWVPPEIFFEVTDGLRGFRKGLANVMVENILMFCTGSGRHLTGLPHVDNVLLELYRHIGSFAVINGYKLEPLF